MLTHVDEKTDPKKFAFNILFDELDYANFMGRVWIPFEDIVIDVDNNIVRFGGSNLTLQNLLKEAMSTRIIPSESLPVVEKIVPTSKKGTSKYFEFNLIDGYNRVEALKQIGYTGYWFDIAKFGSEKVGYEDAKFRFAMHCNAARPKQDSKDNDITRAMKTLVARKVVENTPSAISNWIMENCEVRRDRATRLANEVAKDQDSDEAITLWTPSMIRDEVQDYGVTSYGNYDISRQECGWTVKTGYERELFVSILRKLRLTKNTSYITIHTKMPTGNQNMELLREEIVDSFEELEKDFNYYSAWKKRNGETCWRIEGALPQKKSERDKKEIVKL
jgi:hypothetical protein